MHEPKWYEDRAFERGFRAGVAAADTNTAPLVARIEQLERDMEFYKRMFFRAYEQLGNEVPDLSKPQHPRTDGGGRG